MSILQLFQYFICFAIGITSFKSSFVISYRFPVNVVKHCPRDEVTMLESFERLNCVLDAHGRPTYYCIPNENMSSLVEFCYDHLGGMFSKGECIYLSKSGYLNNKSCKHFRHGCPKQYYISNEIYKYPVCTDINHEKGCYSADPKCTKTLNSSKSAKHTPKISPTTPSSSTRPLPLYLGLPLSVVFIAFFVFPGACFIFKKYRRSRQKFIFNCHMYCPPNSQSSADVCNTSSGNLMT